MKSLIRLQSRGDKFAKIWKEGEEFKTECVQMGEKGWASPLQVVAITMHLTSEAADKAAKEWLERG